MTKLVGVSFCLFVVRLIFFFILISEVRLIGVGEDRREKSVGLSAIEKQKDGGVGRRDELTPLSRPSPDTHPELTPRWTTLTLVDQ